VEALVFNACTDTYRTAERVSAELAAQGTEIAAEDARRLLGRFCEAGLMIEEGGAFLNLAVPARPAWER
jgi:hypothetical protein